VGCGFACFHRRAGERCIRPAAGSETILGSVGVEGWATGALSDFEVDRVTALNGIASAALLSLPLFRWHMLATFSRVARRRQPGPAQRWLSASSTRKQLDFSPTGGTAVQEDAESQPESEKRGLDAREDPSYEQWLATIGRQYKRTDRRNWLGGSVVRLFASYACFG